MRFDVPSQVGPLFLRQLCNAFYLFTKANTHLPWRHGINESARAAVHTVPFFQLSDWLGWKTQRERELRDGFQPEPPSRLERRHSVISFRRHFTLGRGYSRRLLHSFSRSTLKSETRHAFPFDTASFCKWSGEIGPASQGWLVSRFLSTTVAPLKRHRYLSKPWAFLISEDYRGG